MQRFNLTEEQAIKECKEMWKAIKEADQTKEVYLDEHVTLKVWHYECKCPLCQWTKEGLEDIEPQIVDPQLNCHAWNRICPLISQYGKSCYQLGFVGDSYGYSDEWFEAIEQLKVKVGKKEVCDEK